MQTLLYFLVWAGLILFMMRFGCGAHVMGHGRRHGEPGPEGDTPAGANARWVPPASDLDPVCGMTVETAGAKSSVYDGQVHYFCSQSCREKFEASPGSYVKGAVSSNVRQGAQS
jgi:YHS domain-containing protein